MPLYDYECKACGARFEMNQKMSDPLLDACPECRGAVRRLVGGGAGVIVKGGSRPSAMPQCAASCPSFAGANAPCCGGNGPCGL